MNTVKQLLDAGLLEQVADAYQITEHGFPFIQHYRNCQNFTPVLLPRPGVALKDTTHWEKLALLDHGGWMLLPAKGKLRPLDLGNMIDDDKKIYFSNSALDIGAAYMECLLSIPDLLGKGNNETQC